MRYYWPKPELLNGPVEVAIDSSTCVEAKADAQSKNRPFERSNGRFFKVENFIAVRPLSLVPSAEAAFAADAPFQFVRLVFLMQRRAARPFFLVLRVIQCRCREARIRTARLRSLFEPRCAKIGADANADAPNSQCFLFRFIGKLLFKRCWAMETYFQKGRSSALQLCGARFARYFTPLTRRSNNA